MMIDEWMGGWMDGHFQADGHFDIFHPCEPTQISIFVVLDSLDVNVEQETLFKHESKWLDPVEWKSQWAADEHVDPWLGQQS